MEEQKKTGGLVPVSNIEIRRGDSGAKLKHAKYHSSLLDANVLLANEGKGCREVAVCTEELNCKRLLK